MSRPCGRRGDLAAEVGAILIVHSTACFPTPAISKQRAVLFVRRRNLVGRKQWHTMGGRLRGDDSLELFLDVGLDFAAEHHGGERQIAIEFELVVGNRDAAS